MLRFKRNQYGKNVAYVPLFEQDVNGNTGYSSNVYTIGGKQVVMSLRETNLESRKGGSIPYMIKFTIVESTNRYQTL